MSHLAPVCFSGRKSDHHSVIRTGNATGRWRYYGNDARPAIAPATWRGSLGAGGG